MRNFDYFRPADAAAAVAALGTAKGARAKAGGTDLVTTLKEKIASPPALVSLLGAKELAGIRRGEGGLFEIGATTLIADIAADAALSKEAGAVADAAAMTATPLIRNRATLGGNLCQRPRCWYFRNHDYDCSKKGGTTCFAADGENKYHAIFDNVTCNIVHPSNLAPALWAHDATIEVLGPKGKRTAAIAEFWVRPEEDMSTEVALDEGEIVTAVRFAPCAKASGSVYHEVREKQSYDWALVNASVRVDLDGDTVKAARIVVSAVAPVPMRREKAEAAIVGRKVTPETAKAAGAAAVEGATPLRDNGYKVRMLAACVANTILEADRRARANR
jgi:xanthine dehydrogenase YagS FAD-binding subunit